jgi:PTS system nitrogen regulatory IIA component
MGMIAQAAMADPLAGDGGIAGLLPAGAVLAALPACSRDAALLAVARHAGAVTGLSPLLLGQRLQAREAAGSTGLGGGVAVPHARITGLADCVALLARLPQKVEWPAADGHGVDIIVALLSPAAAGTAHLKALARIGRTLRAPGMVAALRDAADADAMRALVSGMADIAA